jgi:hypothetical protein
MGPGDLVVCVRDTDTACPGVLVKGKIYTVLAHPCAVHGAPFIQVDCVGIDGCNSWFSDRFRPVDPQRLSIFRKALTPIREKERA